MINLSVRIIFGVKNCTFLFQFSISFLDKNKKVLFFEQSFDSQLLRKLYIILQRKKCIGTKTKAIKREKTKTSSRYLNSSLNLQRPVKFVLQFFEISNSSLNLIDVHQIHPSVQYLR